MNAPLMEAAYVYNSPMSGRVEIRACRDADGSPLFVGSDLRYHLGYQTMREFQAARPPEHVVEVRTEHELLGEITWTMVRLAGVRRLFEPHRNNPRAQAFMAWLESRVLPDFGVGEHLPLCMRPSYDSQRFFNRTPPSDILWSVKHDGQWCEVLVTENGVRLRTRNGNTLSGARFAPELTALVRSAAAAGACAYPLRLAAEFPRTGAEFQTRHADKLNVFDEIGPGTLAERLARLARIFHGHDGLVRLVPHAPLDRPADALLAELLARGEEGVVLKDAAAPYRNGKTTRWCKLVGSKRLDLAVTGVVEGRGKARGMAAALLCAYQGKTVRVSMGRATHAMRREFLRRAPALIEAAYLTETASGDLRHARFLRERTDKSECDG